MTYVTFNDLLDHTLFKKSFHLHNVSNHFYQNQFINEYAIKCDIKGWTKKLEVDKKSVT